LCARPGCGAAAAATLRFQPTQREAWLVELDDTSPRTEGDLCARHAAALVLPRGWQLHDERLERPDTDEGAPPNPKRRKAPRARRPPLRAVPEPQPQLDLETATPEPLEVPPIADLDDVFDAQTPLLKRAFENVWPLDNNDNNDD
jgi:hypothetical protein